MTGKSIRLSIIGTFFIAPTILNAIEIDWSNQTITSSIEYNESDGHYTPAYFTNATLNEGVVVSFTNLSWFDNADFSGILLKTGAQFLLDAGAVNDATVSFAGLELQSGSLFKITDFTLNSAVFTGLNIAETAELSFTNTAFMEKATFDGSIINGKLTFTGGTLSENGTVAKAPSFKDIQFGVNSTFNLAGAASLNYADFTNTKFGGTFTVKEIPGETEEETRGNDLSYANFTGASFLATSTTNFQGNFIGAIFDNVTFAGKLDVESSNFSNSSFKKAIFSGETTFNGTFAYANFTEANFMAGSVTTLSGGHNNTIFDLATFAGTFDAANFNFNDASFKGANFLGKTSLRGSMTGADFTRAIFGDGSESRFTVIDMTGVVMNQVTVKQGALLYLDGPAVGFQFKNSTVEEGGNLTISSDGWRRPMANSKFNGSVFAGTVLFGETGTNVYNNLDLSGADFTGARFTGTIDFKYVNMENAIFTGTTMTGTIRFTGGNTMGEGQLNSGRMDGANFAGVTLDGNISFEYINLQRASFENAQLTGTVSFTGNSVNSGLMNSANFNGAYLGQNVSFNMIDLSSGTLSNATLNGTTFTSTLLDNANFFEAVFQNNVTISNRTMTGANLTKAIFENGSVTTISNMDVSNALFNQVTLEEGSKLYFDAYGDGFEFKNSTVNTGASFTVSSDGWERSLTNAKFNGSLFTGATFFGVVNSDIYNSLTLTNANFSDAKFTGTTDFKHVNAEGALFENAEFSGNINFTGAGTFNNDELRGGRMNDAKFTGANFSGTIDFTNINLLRASFENAQLTGTVSFTGSRDGQGQYLTGKMNSANFNGATLGQYVTFDTVDLSSSTYSGATIDRAAFNTVSLNNASFVGAAFMGTVSMNNGTMTGADFTLLTFANATRLNLNNMDVSGAKLNQMTWESGSTLYLDSYGSGLEFKNSTVANGATMTVSSDGWQRSLTGSQFRGSTFAGSVFFGVTDGNTGNYLDLGSSDFSGAKFTGTTDFKYVNMASASFANAELTGTVNFTGANAPDGSPMVSGVMNDTDFSGATLSGTVDFRYVNMERISFNNAQLTGTINFTGSKNASYQYLTGLMYSADFDGAYIGQGVLFDSVDMQGATFNLGTIDGATFTALNLSKSVFRGTEIKGNTVFQVWTYLSGATFDGAVFNSSGNSTVTFMDAVLSDVWNGSASFANAIFNGNVLFQNGTYDGVSFAGAQFNAGSNVTFDNSAMATPVIFGETAKYAGTLTFRNLTAEGISFADAAFEATSNTTFDNTNIKNANFDRIVLKSDSGNGARLSVSGVIDNASFEGAVFGQNTEFNFHNTRFDSLNYVNFKNTSFGGSTHFASDSSQTDLSGADFSQAQFIWDSTKGTMFFLQNTGYTLSQFKTTRNYSVANGREKYDFRGMDISNNTTFSGQDFRGSQINSAKFGGLWANDFRDSTYGAGKPASYGESFIDADGNLGGLNKHSTTGYNQNFLIRDKLADSSLAGVYLAADSTSVNSGISLVVGRNNDIFAQGGHSGLDVSGTISMDSSSTFHMRDGASLEFLSGSVLEITVQPGENYIVIADYDSSSWITGLDELTLNVLGDPDHEWKLDIFAFDTYGMLDGAVYEQLVLYWVIPEPATATLGIIGLFGLAFRRRRAS